MLKLIGLFHAQAEEALQKGVDFKKLTSLPVREEIARVRYIAEDKLETFDAVEEKIVAQMKEAEKRIAWPKNI